MVLMDSRSEVCFAAHMKLFLLNGFNGFLMEVADNLELHESVSSDQMTPADHESEVRYAGQMKLFPLNGFNRFPMEVTANLELRENVSFGAICISRCHLVRRHIFVQF